MLETPRKRKEESTDEEAAVVAVVGGPYKLYASRWVQLVLLSLLALISDWVCFATAAVPREFYEATGGHQTASLINAFFVANVASCFLYTDVSRRFGLRASTSAAGWTMFVGCLLRSGVSRRLPPYASVVLGTTLVGVAQPFFQCAPPLLSATWFSKRERSLATATALNANQLGIAAAFVVGGGFCEGKPSRVKPYLDLVTACSAVVALATWALFEEKPPTPPTASAAAREADTSSSSEPPPEPARCLDRLGLTFHRSLYVLLFRTKGFLAPLAAFVTSIAVTNLLSAFAGDYLDRAGARVDLALVGAAFQVAIVLGGIVLGAFVDSTRAYKATTLACLGTSIFLLLVLAVACGYDAHLPATVVVSAILALGLLVGPVQPINAELAVEVAHPFDENAVEATQQLAGNLCSALLVPLYQAAAVFDLQVLPFSDKITYKHPRHDGSGAIKKQIYRFDKARTEPRPPLAPTHPFVQGLPLPRFHFLDPRPHDARGDSILLVLLVAATLSFFANFNFELKRLKLDDPAR
mmetsp:Transcript_2337/g.7174  ORF Transcript_2337/g.7174 Transcript_2337/m.7174 type:complete len:525 (+) Transcript_2337:109-1683(+)